MEKYPVNGSRPNERLALATFALAGVMDPPAITAQLFYEKDIVKENRPFTSGGYGELFIGRHSRLGKLALKRQTRNSSNGFTRVGSHSLTG